MISQLLREFGHPRGLTSETAHAVAEPVHPATQREDVKLFEDPRILQRI